MQEKAEQQALALKDRKIHNMSISLIYSTISSLQEAEKLVHSLFDKRMIACANIIPSVSSYYVWNDTMQRDQEVVMLLKTTTKHVSELIKTIEFLHPYECPAIVAYNADAVSEPFAKWVSSQVNSETS